MRTARRVPAGVFAAILCPLLLAAGGPAPPPPAGNSAGISPDSAAPQAPVPARPPWPRPPFSAWVGVEATYVRLGTAPKSPVIGLVRRGDAVTVAACEPSCTEYSAWAILTMDGVPGKALQGGAVRLAYLRPPPPPEEALVRSSSARFFYGRVLEPGTDVFSAPEEGAPAQGHEEPHRVIALRPHENLDNSSGAASPGWFERASGGFLPASSLALHVAGTFLGEMDPALPLAFVVSPAELRFPKSSGKSPRRLSRYERYPVQGLEKDGRVRIEGGRVARSKVRLALRRPRPPQVPAGEKWVHVDLGEQVLTAYEGDTPVYATLVSAGKDEEKRRTPEGLFRVWRKAAHETMQDTGDDPYYVEEVPSILFFQGSLALHGTFWHDSFGEAASHGCVNLSVGDAAWLFEWAPPPLPPQWHSIMPDALKTATLWVKIEKASPTPLWGS